MIKKTRYFLESHGFDVLSRLSEKIGLSTIHVRLFFMYLTFFTLGLPFVLYLLMALGLKIKDAFYTKRKSVFDL
ncbi:MAG: PspC domain-containing protein [Flavobacteriaceae bacterium]|nr:PspC domain-containing protein [Flavobacteriaceae bacterium]